MGTPHVSCIMPTYGRPAYVDESVAMFLAQDYPAKELIILNDCPGQTFGCDLPGVRVVNREQRYPTLGDKRNAAIEISAGEIIAIWDDDDVYLPWHLSSSIHAMTRWNTEFFRASEFWAYWGESKLHDNQVVDGWVSHGLALFSKELWKRSGGYPAQGVGEDAVFFRKIHSALSQHDIKFPVLRENRSFVLRGKSLYHHISMGGGEQPLDTAPGIIQIVPSPIQEPILRDACELLIDRHDKASSRSQRGLPPAGGDGDKPILSICVSIKNRSCVEHEGRQLRLFPNCVRSLAESVAALPDIGPVELVVADFASDDWPLDQWIHQQAQGMEVRILPIEGDFRKGRGLNAAARSASSENIFFCDADMLIEPGFLCFGLDLLRAGTALFPIMRLALPDGALGDWDYYGFGNPFVTKSVFEATGGVPEFQSWGGEDNIFHAEVSRHSPSRRETVPGLVHQWHPERCRHECYARTLRSDYEDYCRGIHPAMAETPLKVFFARHPDWQGFVHLYAGGRFIRPGNEGGTYDLDDNKRLALCWDQWGTEVLDWDDQTMEFRDPRKPYTLREHPRQPAPDPE